MYEPPAPELIKTPKTAAGRQLHRKYAFSNDTYFQKHVMGNDVQACYDFRSCLDHPYHFHGKWNYHVNTYNTVYESSSRGHIKTTWTQMLNARRMLAYPELHKRGYHNLQISYMKDQAVKWHTGKTGKSGLRGMLSHAIKNLELPYEFGIDAKTQLSIDGIATNGVEFSSSSSGSSIGGTIRMEHTDTVTLDDIINEKMSMKIEDVENILRGAILGTRTPGADGRNTQVIYIGTIVQENDPLDKIRKGELGRGIFQGDEFTGILQEDIPKWRDYIDEWHTHYIHAIDTGYFDELQQQYLNEGLPDITRRIIEKIMEKVESPKPRVLWREKRPIPYHIEQWLTQGEIWYEKEYLLQLTNQQLALFKSAWIDRAKEKGKDWKLRRTPEGDCTTGFDFSISTSPTADYNVFFITEWVDNHEIPLDMVRFRGADLNSSSDPEFGMQGEVEDYIEWKMDEFLDEWRPFIKKNVAEEKGFQRTFGNKMRKLGHDVIPYYTGSDKHNRTTGVPSLAKPFRDNRMIIPMGDSYSIQQMSIFNHELGLWQEDTTKPGEYITKGGHDDTTIAWWMSRIAHDKMAQGQFHFLAH